MDLDPDLKPVWVWNEFDHLDDGNLLVSMRYQNWIVKADYYNGVGTGNIL